MAFGLLLPPVPDHGILLGLTDDDHPQYIKDSEFTQNSGVLVGTATGTFQEETGATLRTSLGLGTGDSPTFTGATLTGNLNLATPDPVGRISWWSGASEKVRITTQTEDVIRMVFDAIEGELDWNAARDIYLRPSDDTTDFFSFRTVGDVPELRTIGTCELKLSNSLGTPRSVTVSEMEDAHDHSGDNSQAHSDYLINDGNDSTSGILTATGFVLGDNEYAEFGVAGVLGGNLGCDAQFYSDGTSLQLQIESPAGGIANPAIEFTYYDYLGAGFHFLVIRGNAPGSPGIFYLDRGLYVKDTVGTTDASILIFDHSTDMDYLTIGFSSDSNVGFINTTGDLSYTPGGNLLINPGGTGVMIGSTATPSEKLDVDGRIELTQQSGSTNDGALWNDSTQEALQTFTSGIEQTLVGVIFTQTADQTIANTTTETTLFGTGVGTLTLPANFWTVGKTIRIEIHGDFADFGTPTVEVQAYYGTTSLIDSQAITLSGLGGTEEWETEVVITCRSVGATGTVRTIIDWEYETTTGSSAIERLDVAGTTTVINTTVSGALDVTFQWGTAAVANTLTSEVGFVEVLN